MNINSGLSIRISVVENKLWVYDYNLIQKKLFNSKCSQFLIITIII